MRIKISLNKEDKEFLKEWIKKIKPDKKSLYRKYREDLKEKEERYKKEVEFWETNELPIYKPRSPEGFNKKNAFSIKPKLLELNSIYLCTKERAKEWVCPFCFQQSMKKYIATGHDHTDYSYDVCDCKGAQSGGGKNWSELD